MVADTAVKESPSGTVAIAPLHMFELRLLGPTAVSKCDQQDGNISYSQCILGHNEWEGLTLRWTGIADSKRESGQRQTGKDRRSFHSDRRMREENPIDIVGNTAYGRIVNAATIYVFSHS
jgi:hypothetical protein